MTLMNSGDRLDTLLNNIITGFCADNAKLTVTPSIALVSTQIIATNTARKGLIIYNNSANSVYVNFGATASSSTAMTIIIPSFNHWVMPMPIYRGQMSAIRNAGSGTLLITELT
jgi:hypothetical protein